MKENIEEEKAIKYYQNKDISFSVDFDTKKLLEELGITEEDSFENHQIRFKTLLNLIEKLQKENEELKEKWDKDTHKLQNDLDIANAERIDWEKAYQEEKDKQDELALHIITLVKKVNNSIPKQKIKDKIEELKKWIYTGKNAPQDFLQYRIKAKIQVLQDLLEEKGE